MTRVEWHGDEWMQEALSPAVELGLQRAGIVLAGEMARNMGSEGGGVARKAAKRRTTGGGFKANARGKGRNVYYAAPVGKFPGVRTGTLRRSMTSGLVGELAGGKVRIRACRVGTNIRYGRFLETGTSRMAPRPWAMRSLVLSRDRLNREFTRTVAGSLAASAGRRASA